MTTLETLNAEAAAMREALTLARDTFDRYATMHAVKGTAEGRQKSRANKDMADICENALLSAAGVELLQELTTLKIEKKVLSDVLNTPLFDDFTEAVKREAAHQVQRWGRAHDRSKSTENWFWLVGFLAGKALRSSISGDKQKAQHHTISSAAALMQWHAAISEDKSGSGVGEDEDLRAKEGK